MLRYTLVRHLPHLCCAPNVGPSSGSRSLAKMAEQILRAEPRTVVGKKVKALRREGLIPGVVYGPVVDGTIQVSVDRREFERYYRAIGLNTLFRLELDGPNHSVLI